MSMWGLFNFENYIFENFILCDILEIKLQAPNYFTKIQNQITLPVCELINLLQ